MRLGIDIRPLLDSQYTGVGMYQLNLLKYFAKRNFGYPDITLFSTGQAKPVLPNDLQPLAGDWKHIELPNKVLNGLWMLDLPPTLNSTFKGIDLMLLPNLNFFPLRSDVPIALTIHDLSFLHDPTYYDRRRKIWHQAIRLEALLKRSAKVITASETTREQLHHHFPFLKPEQTKAIYPGIETKQISDERALNIKQDLLLPDNFILYLGTLEPRKNILSSVKAFNQIKESFPGLKMVIAGKSGWLRRKDLVEITNSEDVLWLNYVTEEQKHALYKLAKIFLWPSYYEGFGFPPLEALAYGTPVIVSHKTSLPEILKDKAYYINPHNYGELRAVMTEILKKGCPKETNPQILQRYSWQNTAEQTLSFLSQ